VAAVECLEVVEVTVTSCHVFSVTEFLFSSNRDTFHLSFMELNCHMPSNLNDASNYDALPPVCNLLCHLCLTLSDLLCHGKRVLRHPPSTESTLCEGRIIDGPLEMAQPGSPALGSLYFFNGDGIIGTLNDHHQAVTALAFSMDGVLLVSGSEDCIVRVWDTVSCQVLQIFEHAKGPISSLIMVPLPYDGLIAFPVRQLHSCTRHFWLSDDLLLHIQEQHNHEFP
jgi:WD40 repeat protein